VRPNTALELAGRDIYQREGCYLCHSQMIRPFRDEKERYGHFSLAVESVYDHHSNGVLNVLALTLRV
jgi:Cbb3-type cytochrome oxidase, cytochrome c subunit